MTTQAQQPAMGEELKRGLEAAWTDFLEANPDGLTSPEDLPDHALVTCEQLVGIVEDALTRPPSANPESVGERERSIRARRYGSCEMCGGPNGHDYAMGGVFCMNPRCKSVGDDVERRFLLVKRGLYYRPGNCGYTGIKENAGRYLASDACPDSGVIAVHEDDAPIFSEACFADLAAEWAKGRIGADAATIATLQAEKERLTGADGRTHLYFGGKTRCGAWLNPDLKTTVCIPDCNCPPCRAALSNQAPLTASTESEA